MPLPDNWIAIGGLAVAALGILVPYFTTKAIIRARRIEIVTEKSIEAYREMAEKMIDLTDAILFSEFEQANALRVECLKIIGRYRFYYPLSLGKEIDDFIRNKTKTVQDRFENRYRAGGLKDEDKPLVDNMAKEFQKLIKRLQEYAGVKT